MATMATEAILNLSLNSISKMGKLQGFEDEISMLDIDLDDSLTALPEVPGYGVSARTVTRATEQRWWYGA